MTALEWLLEQVSGGTVTGRVVQSAGLVVTAVVLGSLLGGVWARRTEDRYRKFYVRKGTRYLFAVLATIGLGIIWRPFAGQLGLVVGLISAGLAFALQGPISSLAGGTNIVSGSIFRVGDRVAFGGVSGDVLDLTPTRTTIMEIGSGHDDSSWVHGRQYTGRIVSVPNSAAFDGPVHNYTANFTFVWEEVSLAVAYRDAWRTADAIMLDEATVIDVSEDAMASLRTMGERFLIAPTDVDPRVFLKATDNYVELTARFVVPAKQARQYGDTYTRRVLDRFAEHGIAIASTTSDVTVFRGGQPVPTVQPPPAGVG
ncbi:mechanosensitive ion channel family protein [Euzebya pacifica]|uniref:mechanosensitive ion channel family protein n=1 Tax=Euzebya pacifica TaxID=1608957 RepID=UPI0030F5172B